MSKQQFLDTFQKWLDGAISKSDDRFDFGSEDDDPTLPPAEPSSRQQTKAALAELGGTGNEVGYTPKLLMEKIKQGDPDLEEYIRKHGSAISKDLLACLEE